VGQLVDRLDSLELSENTLLIFTSDNGPWLVMKENGGSAGLLRDGKGSCWEGGMREPTLVRWPGHIPAGQDNHQVATTLDIFPTLVELAGGSVPQDRSYDGENITALLTENAPKQNDAVYYYKGNQLYALRKGPWKAHFKSISFPYSQRIFVEYDTAQLYNLEHDPSEKYNIARDHADVLAELTMAKEAHESAVEIVPTRLTTKKQAAKSP